MYTYIISFIIIITGLDNDGDKDVVSRRHDRVFAKNLAIS